MRSLHFVFPAKSEEPKILPKMRREPKEIESGRATAQKTSLTVTLLTCRIRLVTRLLRSENKVSNTAIPYPPKTRDKSVTEKQKGGDPLNKFFTTFEAETYVFYKVPKALFTDGKYRPVSTDAKMLYGLLLDRMHLSVKNDWTDKYGRVYQYFTVKQAQELLRFGHEKICRLFSELEATDLILRKRQGQGKPNIIYVKKF